MPGMVDEGEGADDTYCFRCNDRETGVSDVFVHVDILWDDFAAKLARRFQRPVYILYRRDGDEHDRAVQSEGDFEDLCEYLDDTQLQTLPVEVRTLRQKREIRRQPGDGPSDGGGVAASNSQESPRPFADVLGGYGTAVPRDRLVSNKPGQGKMIRPATAAARQQGTKGQPPRPARQQQYGAIQKPRSAWEGAVKEDKSPRNRRTVLNTMGGVDKESMLDRITGLQRQVTDMCEERKQLVAESMRLEKELNKVLLENEELFKAKGGNLFMKVGASSNEVHVMKKRIKALEADKTSIQKDMDKLKAETKVTRLTELEVEKGTYLQEVRRLQQESKRQQEEVKTLQAQMSAALMGEENDLNYNKLYDMYQERCRAFDDAKREARKMQVKTQEAEEDRRLAEEERDKLKAQLIRMRQTTAKAPAGGAEGSASQKGLPQNWKDKEEAMMRELKELKQELKQANCLFNQTDTREAMKQGPQPTQLWAHADVQKRLDLALARANRERDTAEMERADKDADLKKLVEQKRALQMQLHSLGAGSGRKPGDSHKIADRSDMICFFSRDLSTNHVEVQFVDFRVKFRDFCDILQRLYARPQSVAFSYQLRGEEVLVNSEEAFTRCKEVIEDSYCGHGDQAMLITVVEAGAAGVAHALEHRTKAPPDGGSATASASATATASSTTIFASGASNSPGAQAGGAQGTCGSVVTNGTRSRISPPGSARGVSGMMALDTSDLTLHHALDEEEASMEEEANHKSEHLGAHHKSLQQLHQHQHQAHTPAREQQEAHKGAAEAALTFTFACYVDKDKHAGDISIGPGLAWADMRAKLCELAGQDATFTFPHPSDVNQRVVVSAAAEWANCLDLFRQHREDLLDNVLEIDIVYTTNKSATPAPAPAELAAGGIGATAAAGAPVAVASSVVLAAAAASSVVAAPAPAEEEAYEDDEDFAAEEAEEEERVPSSRQHAAAADQRAAAAEESAAAQADRIAAPAPAPAPSPALPDPERPTGDTTWQEQSQAEMQEEEKGRAVVEEERRQRQEEEEVRRRQEAEREREAQEEEARQRQRQQEEEARRRQEEERERKAEQERLEREEAARVQRERLKEEEEAAARRKQEAEAEAERQREEAERQREEAREEEEEIEAPSVAGGSAGGRSSKGLSPPAGDYGDEFEEEVADEVAEGDADSARRAQKEEDAALGVVEDYGEDEFNDEVDADDDVAEEERGSNDWAGGGDDFVPEDDYGNDFEDGGVPDGGGLDGGEVSDDEF